MSRIRRISYAITPEGSRAASIKQAMDLRDKVLSIVDDANFSTSTARKITKKAAFSVVMRSLEESKGLPLSLREHLAMKELNKYISLAKHNKSDFFYASNTDLLPISHPRSTREHSMTASALRIARSRWFAADPRITDEKAKAVLASAFESIPGSVEHLYYTSILLSLPQGMIPGEALIAATDGNSSESRSARARRQRRDRKGRFAYEGGGLRALIRRVNGDIFSISGRVVANAKNSKDVEVEFPDGKIAEINPAKGEYIKAVLPTPDGYSPEPIIPSVTDEIVNEKDLVFLDAPNGWEKDEKYKEFGDKVERYVDSNKEFVVFVSKQDDGTKDYQILNAKSAEQIAVVKNWADVQDKLEGNEDKLLNPEATLPFRQGLIPAEDRPGPNAYERLMAEKKEKEDAIANREAELKKNAEDRVDALDRNVPDGWEINQKNNALMLRRQTEPADLENVYKQNNFVARVIEQGEISVKDVNGLLEEKMYENWASVEKDKDARATEYAQKAREEIKKFAATYGYSEEDLNKIDAMSAEEISSFFLNERLQTEGFADALDDYMTSDMVDAPSERQKAKWKSFGEKLRLINDAGDFPGSNAPVAELPKQPQQPDAPVETTKGGFEYNYPDGAYKINQASEYDPQGRVDEESPDFTDDPIELAQKQDERDILAALEQAVSPREDGENALGVGALPFNRGDEFVPAEALFFALQEAGVDAPMELAKIYDKKLGNDSNEKALNDFRKKAEIVSGNIPELAESFKKVTEQNPDLELPTEAPKFDAEAVELIPLPPLLDGLSQKELDQFMETKDHIPYLPKNEEIDMPEGYNALSQEPFAAWKEVTAENPDAILPEGFSDNPVYLAQEIPTNNLLKELRRSVEPGNEVPGAAVVAFPTDDGEDFVANVPGEAVRDALQLQGVDTNAELRKIAEEGLAGQVDEVFEVELPTDNVVRLVVDGDVSLETQIRDAIAAKKKIAFLYNDTERLVTPTEIFENPRNSNVNVRAIDANGDRKTFTLSKIENSKEIAGDNLEVNPEELVGDYKPTADQIDKLQKGVAELDWLDDGIMFLKPDEGGPRAEAPIEIYDDNGLPEDGPFAKIDVDGNFEWKDKAAYDKYADRLKEIFDAGLEGIDDNQNVQEPQEIDNVPVEQEKLDDNKPAENKTYVEENPEVIKVNAFVEANAGRLAPTKARDVKRGDFLWNNFNKVYEEILDIQPAAFGRVRFLIKDPRNQKEYFRFFDRRSPIRNMRRLGSGEVSEGFKVAPEENKGDGPKRGRALRQPLEQRVEVVAGRDVGGFAYKEGFYKDKNGIVLKPGDKVRHGNPKKNEMYGEGVVLVRAGDQIDEAKKVGGIGRGGKVYKDYVWVQIPGEAGPRLWKARMIVKQEDNVGPNQDVPEIPEAEKFEPLNVVFELDNENIKNGLEEVRKGIKKLNKGGRITTLKNAEAALDNFVGKLDVKDHRGMDITELDALLRRLGRTDRADNLVVAVEQLKNIVEPEKQRLQLDFERKMFDEINNPLEVTVADAKTINAANVKEVIDEIVKRLPDNARDGAGYRLSIARRHLLLYLKNISTDDDLVYADPKSITEAISYLEGMPVDVSDIKKQLEDLKKSVKGYAKNNKKPFGKANMPFIDPIALQEKRVADGVNKFDLANAQNLKALVADDQFFADNPFAASYKDELQNFFAQEGEVPLASLSVDARQALSQIVSSEIRNLGVGSAEEKKVRANEYARMALGLHEEKLAFNPNRDDLGPAGELLKDIDFNAVFSAGQNLASNKPTNLEINGQPTEFKIQKVGEGINANYNYRLIDKASGQIFYFKRERTLETADSEYASNQLARALKIAGVPVVVKHNNDAQVLIMTNAGDSLDFDKDPNIAGNAGKDYLDIASRAAIADLIAFGILDAVILNTDRHTHNFLLGGIDRGNVDGNGREELQLLPIDHGFAQLFQTNYRINDPLAFMTGGDGRDGGRINKAFAKDIGAIAYKELIDMTVQQAIQAIERGDYLSDVKPASRQAIIDRLLILRGIDVDKWKLNLAKKL